MTIEIFYHRYELPIDKSLQIGARDPNDSGQKKISLQMDNLDPIRLAGLC